MTAKMYDDYATDTTAENDGQWVNFRGDVQVKLRSENSTKFRDFANQTAKKQRQIIVSNGGVLPPKLSDRNDIEACARVLVVDWKNVTDREGTPLPCTPDNVRKVLTDLPSLRRDIIFAARVDETFKAEDAAAVEAMGETSPPASAPI